MPSSKNTLIWWYIQQIKRYIGTIEVKGKAYQIV